MMRTKESKPATNSPPHTSEENKEENLDSGSNNKKLVNNVINLNFEGACIKS